MTLEEHIQQLADIVVEETRHQDYRRVTELADMYYSFITGEGLDDMMRQFSISILILVNWLKH